MAAWGGLKCNYLLLICISCIFFPVTAELNIIPSWTISSNGNVSEPCSLQHDHIVDKNVTVFTGNLLHACNIQLTVTLDTRILIDIPSYSSASDFIYVERQGELLRSRSRYVAISGDGCCFTDCFIQESDFL